MVGGLLSPVAEEHSPISESDGIAPRFEVTPKAMMKLNEGHPLTISCVITGTPRPRITWARNGAIIKSGERIRLVELLEHSKFLF